jgi:hypothetical protein
MKDLSWQAWGLHSGLGSFKQEEQKMKASMGYRASPYLKQQSKTVLPLRGIL